MFASVLGQFGHPFYAAFAWILAGTFALIPNVAVAIALLTLVVMVVLYPITLRSIRGSMKMRVLAPDIERLRHKYKAQPGMSASERRDRQLRQHAELAVLYQQNDVSMVRSYLPLVLQFPILIVLYGTIRGLVHQSVVGGVLKADPLYLSHGTRLFNAIAAAHGHLVAFGLNLADSVRTPGIGWEARIPLLAMVLVAVVLQYVQIRQSHQLNPAQGAAFPHMERVLKVVPLLLAVVYISLPAGVTVYFITAGLIRVIQQAVMYPRDPHIRTSLERLRAQTGSG